MICIIPIDHTLSALYTIPLSMAKSIRKQIDIDEETLRGVRVLAAMNDTNSKRYIENIIVQHVKANKIKITS